MRNHPHFHNSTQVCPALKHYRKWAIGGQLHIHRQSRLVSTSFHGSVHVEVSEAQLGTCLERRGLGLYELGAKINDLL